MKISKLAGLVSLVVALSTVTPTFADDGHMDKVVDGSLMVTRVGGVGAGLVVGTPVACVRSTYKTYIDWTQAGAEHLGGKDCGPSCALVSLVTIPGAIVWGGLTGLYYGGKNAVTKGFNEPFHPDSFSLGKEYTE